MQASPVSLLAYIGEKMRAWSDTKSPHWDTKDVIATVALYYLRCVAILASKVLALSEGSKSFASATLIYHESKDVREAMTFRHGVWKASPDCLLGYTAFVSDKRPHATHADFSVQPWETGYDSR